jgi:hypothetical protein
MKRRDFLLVACAAGLTAPATRAQAPGKLHRIAFVHSSIPADQLVESGGTRIRWVGQFFRELRRLGNFDGVGGNLIIERYSGEGIADPCGSGAKGINSRPDVVVTVARLDPGLQAVSGASQLPACDPVSLGLPSLARPVATSPA